MWEEMWENISENPLFIYKIQYLMRWFGTSPATTSPSLLLESAPPYSRALIGQLIVVALRWQLRNAAQHDEDPHPCFRQLVHCCRRAG